MIYSFDIETIPNSSMIDKLPEVEVKLGNVKDPAKIAAKKAEAKAKQIDKMALNPLYGRICAAVLTYRENDAYKSVRFVAGDNNSEEQELLLGVSELLLVDTVLLTTCNGNGFDLPFLYKRLLIMGCGFPKLHKLSHWIKRYNTETHIDLMQVWSGWNSMGFEKLEDVSSAILGEGKLDIDFNDFPELLLTDAGRKKILDYCEVDTIRTLQLFEIFSGNLF